MPKRINLRRVNARSGTRGIDPAERIATLTRTARGNWLGLLSYLAFVGVTLLGVEDADFFISERETALPLIGVTIPTNLFFYIAPGLGAMLYIHLHLYLMKLWKALADLPNNGTFPAGEGITPWVVSDMALAGRPGGVHAYPLRRLAYVVVFLSIFVAGPAVLAGFWWRSMPKHDELLTIVFCGLPLGLSILAGVESWLFLRRHARVRRTRSWEKMVWGLALSGLSVIGFLTTEGTFSAYAQVSSVDLIVAQVEFESLYDRKHHSLVIELEKLDRAALETRFAGVTAFPDPEDIDYLANRELKRRWWMRTWVPKLLRPAQLAGVAFVDTPDEWRMRYEAEQVFRNQWCEEHGIEFVACGRGPLARRFDGLPPASNISELLDWLNTHQTRRITWCFERLGIDEDQKCEGVFKLLDSIYQNAWAQARKDTLASLPEVDFSGVDWRNADLQFAQLPGATMRGSRMEGANLSGANLEGADLRSAALDRASLFSAIIAGADLRSADLIGANLTSSTATMANLLQSDLSSANLRFAWLDHSTLANARLQGTNLENIKWDGLHLSLGTKLDGAFISHPYPKRSPYLISAKVRGLAWRNLDLSESRLRQSQLEMTFGDASVVLPASRLRPKHWPNWELPSHGSEHDFKGEWHKWQADPDSYTPPPKPAED